MPPSPGASAYVPPAPQAFSSPPQPQQTQQAPRPVGRPSGDPEMQEARAERSQLRQRLKNILPAAMTDGKIAIYRLEGRKGRNKSSAKPVMTILFRDLEKALSDESYSDTGEFVKDRLIDKYGDKGRFLWEAQDNRGRPMPEAGEAEVDLSDGADDTEPEEEIVEDEETLPDDRDDPRDTPSFFNRAPPPPAFDAATHAQQVREIITEEKKGAESMLTVMMTMMQAQQQQQQTAMQLQLQQAEQRRIEEDRRREREEAKEREERKLEMERLRLDQERREKEEQRREDRERERRLAEQQMQMQFMQAIMNRPDTMTPMLMKMIENKGDRDGMKEVFALMTEGSKQAMAAQGEATKSLLGAQAEASKTIMSNVLGISQSMIQNMVESQAEPTDDPMEKVARIFKMVAPALGALSSNAAASVNQQPQQRLPQAQQQAAQPQQPQQIPPAEYIKGGLYTIMRLETGEIPIQQRFNALKWCAENLPKPMLDAIRSGVEDQVLSIGAQGMDDKLMVWIAEEKHIEFLRDCIKDIQRMLIGALTQNDARESLEKHAAYMQAKAQPAAEQTAEQIIPAEVKDAEVAQPVETPTPGKRRAPPPTEAVSQEGGAP